jgi:hypothetical protein
MTVRPTKSPRSRESRLGKSRLGWSGATALAGGNRAFDDVLNLLPSRKSVTEVIAGQLADLKARTHGWLHQDEFGPSRGDQAAAVKAVMLSVRGLCHLLQRTPSHIRARLDDAIRRRDDGLHACVLAMDAAAADVEKDFKRNSSSHADINWLSRVCQAVATLLTEAETLDDNTEGQIADTAMMRGFDLSQVVTSEKFGLVQIEAWLNSYANILFETLSRLNDRRGAEERVTLKLMVEELCKIYEHETGMLVTAHAMKGHEYTARVETDAGRFVTAAVEALLPDQAWFEQRAEFANSTRAKTFLAKHQPDRARQIIVIMRDFVARRAKPIIR